MRFRLTGGAYKARSVVADAQRQINLFAEFGHPEAIVDIGQPPSPIPALYPTPGLRVLGIPPVPGVPRGLYHGNNGLLFYVCGTTLYSVGLDWSMSAIGTIAVGTSPVSMTDNGLTMVLVDGTPSGYQVDLTTLSFSAISATTNGPTVAGTFEYGFYGSDRVAIIDGFMLFNQPGTRNFYCTQNGNVLFDSLNIAAKNGNSDNLVAAVVHVHTIWLIGEKTSEVWFNAGAADFPFAAIQGPFIEHGCLAKYSIARANESIFWLSQDQTGGAVLVRTKGYATERVSTHAIEAEWSTYPTVTDAEAFVFRQAGHEFYQLNFPSADKTWRFDNATGDWHEAVWLDTNGTHHKHRARLGTWHNNTVVVADWQTGTLYALDPAVFSDVGQPIKRLRCFPHIVGDGDRVMYRQFQADIETGTGS